MTVRQIEPPLTCDDLVVELERHTRDEGLSAVLWSGVTVYRFTRPTETRWNENAGLLSIAIVVAGRRATVVSGRRLRLQGYVSQATPHQPFFCLVLQVDPRLIRKVWAAMGTRQVRVPPRAVGDIDCVGSDLDDQLLASTVRFLRSLASDCDRRVLSPLYLEETVYRILQSEQCSRLVGFAVQEERSPVADTLNYIADHLAESLTVTALARRVHLSPSALSRAFRETTGRSPYQYLKEARLVRARELLVEGRHGSTDVAYIVGYISVSHFIKEFRNRFGATPGEYVERFTLGGNCSRYQLRGPAA